MIVEHLDDLPVLGALFDSTNLSKLLEAYFPDHGHWKGISGGQLTLGWLLYILSEGDHRLSHVEDWASARLLSLSSILQEPALRALDFCDDRLGRLLDRFSNDDSWESFELAFNQDFLEVYSLKSVEGFEVVRTDSFNVPEFREEGELFRHGYSKQRRSDQPFCKVMLSMNDCSMTPIAVDIIQGSGPDSNHYCSVIERVQSTLKSKGNLYVGDAQLGSLSNRYRIHSSGDYYLCPLGKKQCGLDKLYSYLDDLSSDYTELASIFTTDDSHRKSAYFGEVIVTEKDAQTGQSWPERRILVYSPDYANGLIQSFNNRLDEAEEKIKSLVISKAGRRNPKTLAALYERIGHIIKKYKVEDCFEIDCSEKKEKYRVQKYKGRKAEERQTVTLYLNLKRDQHKIALKKRRLGWQLYASNAPIDRITTTQLVTIYRDQYRIEHLFDYMINRHTGLLPVYLQKESRVKGLVRLLSLGMKFSMLLQYQVREELKKSNQRLKGIYPGNKGRSTNMPTTTLLLSVFRGISAVFIKIEEHSVVEMTPLTETQNEVLALLKFKNIYLHIRDLLKTNIGLRET